MKLVFTLENISGRALVARFAAAIKEDGVGHDNEGEWSATLSDDGRTWRTNWSRFSYQVINYRSDRPAVVEYDGGWRGFLAQNLIPQELRGETIDAEVIQGSALARHHVDKFVHTDAKVLAEAYGLMQTANERNELSPLKVCIAAVEAARKVREHIGSMGLEEKTAGAHTGSNAGGVASCHINAGDPAVYVWCRPGGEYVQLEIKLHPWGEQSTAEHVANRAVSWLDRLRPVLRIAA